jgi:hypothetical protein
MVIAIIVERIKDPRNTQSLISLSDDVECTLSIYPLSGTELPLRFQVADCGLLNYDMINPSKSPKIYSVGKSKSNLISQSKQFLKLQTLYSFKGRFL